MLEPVHFARVCPHCEGAGCPLCAATGLPPQAAAVTWCGLRLPELLTLGVDETQELFTRQSLPSERLQNEIRRRLDALVKLGLGYLSLDRPSPTLSRGEAQRVRLAVVLVSRLHDMLHILDEPTIGLHLADVSRLFPVLRELKGPVVYVEHDRAAAAQADLAIDLGPGAGRQGGLLLFSGTPAQLWRSDTATGRHFSLREKREVTRSLPPATDFLHLRQAHLRNLQSIDVKLPLGRLTVVTGVSGSGKSTLVEDVLVASLKQGSATGCQQVVGPALRPMLVDQSPIGRNPRSNPATYTKLAEHLRDFFAEQTGLSPSHFSFNRPAGACPACRGLGAVELSLRYLPSSWIPCSCCEGRRFSEEVLQANVTLAGRSLSIADLLAAPIAEVTPLLLADDRFGQARQQRCRKVLQALADIGLAYLPLGQPSPTLSGGEAQRIKLARFLGRPSLKSSLLVLDEPSTGLHPADLDGLLLALDRLVTGGATVVIVEHNPELIRAAHWVVDLGPGAGPDGGRVLYQGPPDGLGTADQSFTGAALQTEHRVKPNSKPRATRRKLPCISIRGAQANNLKGIDVDLPKEKLTVITGVSGSGKSSLMRDVLETEARRRFLESLSLYERQGTREGPQAPVEQISGLGVTQTISTQRDRFDYRNTVGTVTEITLAVSVLLAQWGDCTCLQCGAALEKTAPAPAAPTSWCCPSCATTMAIAAPQHFSGTSYRSACQRCHGIGTLQVPNPDKLILDPEKPLCGGAMYSPGFFPKGYLCKPFNGGYDMVRALGQRHHFDPATTPWNAMSLAAQQAFLFGDPEPLEVNFVSRTQSSTNTVNYPGFYGWIRDWDVGGTYTDTEPCPDCNGARLRPEYLAVTIAGKSIHELSELPFTQLYDHLQGITPPQDAQDTVVTAWCNARVRLQFLEQVGLGYLHLNRVAATLSAGEAQRVKLAGLLGSELTALCLLLDEPSRGLHPSEVEALAAALARLRDAGNTVVVIEHDPTLIAAADHLIELGPGAGTQGGKLVAAGSLAELQKKRSLTARWLCGELRPSFPAEPRSPDRWLTIQGACANNLRGQDIRLPLGVLAGVCGVSGSGKSTLLVDTIGLALAPKKQTTSVAYEPVAPGQHRAIEGEPERTVIIDQARAGVHRPIDFLGLRRPLLALFASSEAAEELGVGEKQLARPCSACKGQGRQSTDMGFLPPLTTVCETCEGTGLTAEAAQLRVRGISLTELLTKTLDEAVQLFGNLPHISRLLQPAQAVGLGYLALGQTGESLSGGEAQRLKIARELARGQRRRSAETLYILDEPTVGLHMEDVARLCAVLHRLVDDGHSVVVIEHHPHLLASCDWLVELGPKAGPEGGRVVSAGPPAQLARGVTATARYLHEVLEQQS
jgi:excinuclease ABC subunit A